MCIRNKEKNAYNIHLLIVITSTHTVVINIRGFHCINKQYQSFLFN